MDHNASPSKATPTRRRQGRQNGRSAGHKAYASENDVPSLPIQRPYKTPRTPNKINSASSTSATLHGNTSRASPKQHQQQQQQQQRNRNTRSRLTSLPLSPENDHSPPQSAVAKSSTSIAFAGATFHASPAPSALPVPSFLAKWPGESPLSKRDLIQEPSPPATDSEVLTPYRPSNVPKSHESPLDFMFRAHREEKLRYNLTSNFDLSNSPSTVPQARRSDTRQTFYSHDDFELDRNPAGPVGPAFSTPYRDRIKAARSSRARPSQDASSQTLGTMVEDPAEPIKRLLFGGASSPDTGPSVPIVAASTQATAENIVPIFQKQTAGTLSGRTNRANNEKVNRTNNVQIMEDDLRRLLKIDLSADTAPTERQLSTR